MVRVSIRPRLISLVAAATAVPVSQDSAFRVSFRFGWLPRMGHSQCASLTFRRNGSCPCSPAWRRW